MAQVPDISEFYKAHEAGRIMMDTDPTGRLVCFRYTEETAAKADWDDVTLNARGIVFEKATGNIVARPYTKFFNYHELFTEGELQSKTRQALEHAGLPTKPEGRISYVLDKIDGSLGVGFFYDGEWYVSTQGNFTSPQALFATDWLRKHLAMAREKYPDHMILDPNYTTLFEITWCKDKHPIRYDRDELVVIGLINKETGEELKSHGLLCEIGFDLLGSRAPSSFRYRSIEEIAEVCKTLPHDKEGFVVTWENGFKLKLKGAAYLKMLEFYTNCTDKNLWRAYDPILDIFHAHMDPVHGYKFLDDEPLIIPEELTEVKERMERFRDMFNKAYDYVKQQGAEIMARIPDMKERAIYINKNYHESDRAPLLMQVSPKRIDDCVKRAVVKTMLRPDENSNNDGFNAFFGYKE